MRLSLLNTVLGCLLICLIWLNLYWALKSDRDNYLPQVAEPVQSPATAVPAWLGEIPKDSLFGRFPYQKYISATSITDIAGIERDARLLDSLTGEHSITLDILATAFTDSLLPAWSKRATPYVADSLIVLMQEIEGFQLLGKMPGPNKELYAAIYQYWMSQFKNWLDGFSRQNPGLKYQFKFRFLAAKCDENRYGVAPKVTETEKIVNNIAESKWSYLYQRIWNTPLPKRMLIIGGFLLTLSTYFFTFIYFLKRKKTQQK
jgi:hypothetical protein